MKQTSIAGAAKSRILISDGALGTELMKRGLKPGECPELWNLTRPEDIAAIAKNYADAGADIITTNSFGGNACKLEHFGLKSKAHELNCAAAAIVKAAAPDKWIAGSIGSTGKMLIIEEITENEMYHVFAEQAVALSDGGADAAIIETMSDIEEARIAIKAVKENTSLEIICTFAFDKIRDGAYRTMFGISPEQAALAAAEQADIIGTNCGNGIENIVEIAALMKAAVPELPVIMQANAGLPSRVSGVDVFPDSAGDMARFVKKAVESGVSIIGGCCGTTPEHIKAFYNTVNLM